MCCVRDDALKDDGNLFRIQKKTSLVHLVHDNEVTMVLGLEGNSVAMFICSSCVKLGSK